MPTAVSDNPPADKYDRYFRTEHLEADLRRRSVRGGAAIVSAQFIRRFAITLGATAILARLLTPEDFGLLAMVAAFTNLLVRFKDLGLAAATVQRKEVTHEQVSTLFWINAGIGAAGTVLTAAFAPLVAWLYGEPRLIRITLVLAVGFSFGGITVQHQALLRRQMRFTGLAAIQIGSTFIGALIGVGAALLGAGYWSLVVMQLSSTVTSAVGLWVLCGWRPGRPVRGCGVRPMLAFGGNLTLANLLLYLVRNLDNILIGWRWGAEALGYYAKAYQLLMWPIRQFNAPLTSVAIPALSRLQDNPERFRLFYRMGLQLLTTVGMPLVMFSIVVADEVVLLVLGEQWTTAVPIFRVLGPAAFLGTFNVAASWVYISSGRTDRQLRWNMISSAVTLAAFFMGLRWGALGVAASFSIAQMCVRPFGLLYCYRGTFLGLADLWQGLWRPATASAAAALLLLGAHRAFPTVMPLLLAFLIDLCVYGLFYILCWLALPNGLTILREMRVLAKDLRSRPKEVDSVLVP